MAKSGISKVVPDVLDFFANAKKKRVSLFVTWSISIGIVILLIAIVIVFDGCSS